MGQTISQGLYRVSTGPVALAALLLFIAFLVLILPAQAEQAERYSREAGSPDSSFVYSAEDLYRMAESYGPEGRAAYVRARFTFDLVWPLAYAAFLVTAISWVYARAFPVGSLWRRLNLVPLLGVLLDYGENAGAALVMARYPTPTPLVDGATPIFTVLKWTAVNGSFGLLLLGIGVGLWRWVSGRRRQRLEKSS